MKPDDHRNDYVPPAAPLRQDITVGMIQNWMRDNIKPRRRPSDAFGMLRTLRDIRALPEH